MAEPWWWILLAIAGLTGVSVVTRSFFFISERPLRLPAWMRRGLRYAPVAALSAVTAPGIFLRDGSISLDLSDPHLLAALAACLVYFWQRRSSMALPWAIVAGLLVYVPLQMLP
ncbi:MAG: AzlD domain-containing protein [Ottowia sp.]|nr:AzlD domain-containing protein [Ottowia sp.]